MEGKKSKLTLTFLAEASGYKVMFFVGWVRDGEKQDSKSRVFS